MRSHCIDLFKTDLHNICFVPSVSVYRAQLYRLGFYWFDFHFGPFGGVMMAFPGYVQPLLCKRIDPNAAVQSPVGVSSVSTFDLNTIDT